MYRIMIAESKRDNFGSLYRYLTTTIGDRVKPLEIATKEELDTMIQSMLNKDGYSKNDFIIVQVVEYDIDATKYTDDTATTTGDPTSVA